jgi:Carboxypeptidase regulatory-like domain
MEYQSGRIVQEVVMVGTVLNRNGRVDSLFLGSKVGRFVGVAALLATSLLWNAPYIHAQAVTGTIMGIVHDPTGAAVPGVQIVVTDIGKGTSQTVRSNASGNYSVYRLIPDTYSVKASAKGFTPSEVQSITVDAGSTAQVNLVLKVAGSSQNVTVTSGIPQLQTDSADTATVLNNRQLQDLPNQNRNFTTFALLTPGVQRGSFNTAPTENPQGTQSLEVNGSNYGSLGYYLDGTDNREPIDGIIVINPTLDSLSESKVDTQNFPAEFGGAIAGYVSAQTRSGSNDFHGDAFFFRRSAALEARDPFTQFQPDAVTGKDIPDALYSQFGGSAGGRILKDKAFFFADYQGIRQKIGTSLLENVPTALVRSTCLNPASTVCNLSEYGGSATTPNTVVTPQGLALLSALPAPNTGMGTTNNYAASGNGNNNGDQADLRIDDQVSGKIHAFARYDYARFTLLGEPVFGAAGGTGFGLGNTTGTDTVQNQSAAAGFDDAINSSLLTDFRFGFLDYHVSENKIDNGTSPATADGIPNLNTGLLESSGSPTYDVTDGSVSPFGEQSCNCPLQESEQVFQLNNNWTKTVGNHSIRFGADLRYAFNLRNASDNNRAGLLTFDNSTNSGTAAGGPLGSGIVSILEGQIAEFQRFDVYNSNAANRQKRLAFYAQDNWRVTPKLTLDYGVRWDIIFPETVNGAGNGGFTDLTAGIIRVAGVGGIPTNGGENIDLTDIGGRFGFAYQAKPGTVLRGAFGQVFDDVGFFGTIFGSSLTQNVPVVTQEGVGSASATTPIYSYTSIPAQTPQYPIPTNGIIPILPGINYNVRPNTLVLPEVYQFNVSLQQQVTRNMTFTIAYVGNIGERVYPSETEGYDVNRNVLPTSPSQFASTMNPNGLNERRPYYNRFSSFYDGTTQVCCSQDINSLAPAAREHYNALQTTVEQRFAHGFQLLANYTWSRAINYGSTYFAIDPSVEKGPSDTNRTQLFVLSGLYELPFGKGKMAGGSSGRLVNAFIGGWQLAGTTTWEGGLPFTPTYAECGSDQDVDNNSATPSTSSDCRPDITGAGSANGFVHGASQYNPITHSQTIFTPVAALTTNGAASGPFVRPAFGTIGDVGRNALRGPSDYFADASLFKTFDITKSVKAQFQFQAFNVFNHVPLGVPNAADARCIDCATSTEAGQITNVDSAVSGSGLPYMRQLQFGAKLVF